MYGSEYSKFNETWTFILPFSAKTHDGLLRRVRSLVQRSHLGYTLLDLAYTLGCRRSFFPARGFLLSRQYSLVDDLQERNLVLVQGQTSPTPLSIAMIFTGQGAQWPQMGLALFEKHASFRASIQALDANLRCLKEAPSWTIEQTLLAGAVDSHVSHPCRSQPVCTAIQIALVDLFSQWGIVPKLVIGHSSGEIAAAYAAGHITSNEAIVIAYYRGLVVSRSTFRGAMMAIGIGEQDADAEIHSAGLGGGIRVACKNSPESATLSGNEEAVNILLERLSNRKVFVRKLRTNSIAYHSYDMANLGSYYQTLLSTYLQMRQGSRKFTSTPRMISSVTAEYVDATETSQSSYWRANLESPVEFARAISTAFEGGAYHFLELGPHSALELPLKQIHAHHKIESPFLYASAIVRGVDSIKSSLNAVGKLFVSGHDINFGQINAIPREDGTVSKNPAGKVLTDLPGYPWQHDVLLWNESRTSIEYRFRKHSRHDLLGSSIPGGSTPNFTWRNLLKLKEVPWLADHQLEVSIVFPAAGYMVMAVEALSRIFLSLPASSNFSFRSVHFLNALVIPSDSNAMTELITDVRACRLSHTTDSKTWYHFEISSVTSGDATRHATGLICISPGGASATEANISRFDQNLEPVEPKRWYEQLAALGLRYGPHFRPIHGMYVHRSRSRRALRLEIHSPGRDVNNSHQESEYILHPAIIDAMLQSGLMADSSGDLTQLRAGLPVSIEAFTLAASDAKAVVPPMIARATGSQVESGTILFDVDLHDAESRFIASMHGVRMAEYVAMILDTQLSQQSPTFDLVWKPDVDHLQPSSFQAFINLLHQDTTPSRVDPTQHGLRQLAGILDLVQHKKSICRILDIDPPSSGQDNFGDTIRADEGHEELHHGGKVYAQGKLEDDGSVTLEEFLAEAHDHVPRPMSVQDRFDVIVCREVSQELDGSLFYHSNH